jgi:hypothetical protein
LEVLRKRRKIRPEKEICGLDITRLKEGDLKEKKSYYRRDTQAQQHVNGKISFVQE